MEQRDSDPSSSRSFSPTVEDSRGIAGPSSTLHSSSSRVREGQEHNRFDRDHERNYGGYRLGGNWNLEPERRHVGFMLVRNFAELDEATPASRKDTWACVALVVVLCFFVPTCLFLGFYGPEDLGLGPNSSLLIRKNPYFIQNIKVEELDHRQHRVKLYAFHELPPLDAVTSWSETHEVSIPADSHKAWILYLNEGSQINISYTVNSRTSSVVLIIDQGFYLPEPNGDYDYIARWFDDPASSNSSLSWNLIHGSGMIHQKIPISSSYIVAVGNSNSEALQVTLDFDIRAFVYNTTNAYCKCTISDGKCSFRVLFLNESFVVITSPGRQLNTSNDEWYVRLSYGPRWILCVLGMGGMAMLILLGKTLLYKFMGNLEDVRSQRRQMRSQRTPLLSDNVDDVSSRGSSYESASADDDDDDDLEETTAIRSLDPKSAQKDENSTNIRCLCAICYDAPRGCFFLPCGHCVACFECGTRIAEAAGSCPICRRKMKKVKRIFTV